MVSRNILIPKRILVYIIMLFLFVNVINFNNIVYAQPYGIPTILMGQVTKGGIPVIPGSVLYAINNGKVLGMVIVKENGKYGPLEISRPEDLNPNPITFLLNNEIINETYIWVETDIQILNLTVYLPTLIPTTIVPEQNNLGQIDESVDPTGSMGPMGPMGPIGITGPIGPQGEQGSAGLSGLNGPVGPQGNPGSQGEQGPPGMPGSQGEQGPPGVNGEDSSNMLGMIGVVSGMIAIGISVFTYLTVRKIKEEETFE